MKKIAITLLILFATTASAFGQEIYVKLDGNLEFSGAPVELTQMKFTTSFGEVDIPLDKINGIKINANQKGNAIIIFKNGDAVSGTASLDSIKVKTTWGMAQINMSSIDSITFSKNGRFYSETSSGNTVWRFTDEPIAPASGTNSQLNPAVNRFQPQPVRPIGGGQE